MRARSMLLLQPGVR